MLDGGKEREKDRWLEKEGARRKKEEYRRTAIIDSTQTTL